ncbi:MAG TPA: hypothetical protein PKE57_06000, partial [Cellvibrionaceae bacterium]|nr:hypothetical protein [Cellvibrionaceae bacterium]
LTGIVRINEKIKQVVSLAFNINLLALNALVLSRQAGDAALGFAVISAELRSFSRELAQAMAALSDTSFELVNLVSLAARKGHKHQLLARALAAYQGPLNQRLALSSTHLNAEEKALAARFEHLHEHFERAGLSVRLGTIIARSLKIEATYGGSQEAMLAQVACEFDRYIDTIPRLLAELKHHLPPRALML